MRNRLRTARPTGAAIALPILLSFAAAGEIPFAHRVIDGEGPRDPWIKIAGDVDGDRLPDVVIGGRNGPLVWYAYPDWKRATIAQGGYATVDGELADIDRDGDLDCVVGGALWYENPRPRGDPAKRPWIAHRIGRLRAHDVEVADLDGDGDPDVVTRDQGPRGRVIAIWRQETPLSWSQRRIDAPVGEGLTLGDLDRDGDPDIVIGGRWYENPGEIAKGAWKEHIFARWHETAVAKVADIDGDGRPDVVLTASEALYRISWFEASADPGRGPWTEHRIDESVDYAHGIAVADMDGDGDIDVATAEMHQSPRDRVLLFRNDGEGARWTRQVLSTKGSHNIQVADIGSDGAPDIIGANWSGPYQPVQLWENGLRRWRHLSTAAGDLPPPGASDQQTAALIFDIDGDGGKDFAVGCRRRGPSVLGYRRGAKGWIRLVIEPATLPVEAGATCHDIDDDGDLDLVMGADASGHGVWWWENPRSRFDPKTPWKRRAIKRSGANKHHHQIFGDFDGDGRAELAFWNQRARTLWLAEIPADPRRDRPWPRTAIYTYAGGEHEGLAAADIDGDGKIDIVGGGRWFEHEGGTRFTAHVIDDGQRFAKAAAGQLKEGGRAEAVFCPGDARGRLKWYEWDGKAWIGHDPLGSEVVHGHSLELGDFDGDGHLDIFCAEMHSPGHGDRATMWILHGDGRGRFRKETIAVGCGNHESQIGDLDGDGDIDILDKPYHAAAPRLDIWLNPRHPR